MLLEAFSIVYWRWYSTDCPGRHIELLHVLPIVPMAEADSWQDPTILLHTDVEQLDAC